MPKHRKTSGYMPPEKSRRRKFYRKAEEIKEKELSIKDMCKDAERIRAGEELIVMKKVERNFRIEDVIEREELRKKYPPKENMIIKDPKGYFVVCQKKDLDLRNVAVKKIWLGKFRGYEICVKNLKLRNP